MNRILAGQERYNRPAVFFHWAIFLLVAFAYLSIEVRGPKGTDSRVFWSNVHYLSGTLVLTFAVLRIVWRFASRAPGALPQPALLSLLSELAHLALYVFIVAQPLLGIMTLNFAGKPVTLAWIDWSFTLFGPNPGLRSWIKDAHEVIGNVFYYVIGLHALAALWHHFVKRDATLRRMTF
ncbi:cytochrome B [Burkholderia sp. ABCPW 14]|uniref:cytochrome b n=1 Tax=Burkholderia sp. ABCPW 14 TaxID=1637860 RepID=UPI000770C784|nr:cytochrome b [Burkholderia sp. ABCPW 14]KVD78931.1 cytochrome B [Burkholderia sp. ABCPW 14]